MKKFLTIILTVIIAVGAVFVVGCSSEQPSNTTSNNENALRVQSVRMSMASPMTVTGSDGTQYIEKSLTATVLPSTAPNRKVDFSVMWGENASRASEPISDYITVVQESDGSATAKVRCHKSFGDDKIIIKVITRDGGFTDICTVSFVGFCSDIEFDTSSLTIRNDSIHGGEHAVLITNNTYNIPIEPTNIFNDATASFEIENYGWIGTVKATNLSGGGVPYTLENYTGYKSIFSVELSNNKLKIIVNGYSLETNSSFPLSELLGVGDSTYTSKGIPDGSSAYFYVQVKDTLTGTVKEFKFWISTQVNSVSLNETNITF